MVTLAKARSMALRLPRVVEAPHFGSDSYRVGGKIFAQLDAKTKLSILKLSLDDQASLTMLDPKTFTLIPYWSRSGWTRIRLDGVTDSRFGDLVSGSWSLVALKKLKPAARSAKRRRSSN